MFEVATDYSFDVDYKNKTLIPTNGGEAIKLNDTAWKELQEKQRIEYLENNMS